MAASARTTAATNVERDGTRTESAHRVMSVCGVCRSVSSVAAMTPLSLLGVVAALLPVHVRALNNGYTLPAMGYRCVDRALHFRLFFA